MNKAEKADRIARQRAILFLILAAVLVLSAVLGLGDQPSPARLGAWAVLALLVGLNLSPLAPRLRRDGLGPMLDDETARMHRGLGLMTGFWAMMAATLLLGLFGESWHMASFTGARMVMTAGLATALIVTATADLRALRD